MSPRPAGRQTRRHGPQTGRSRANRGTRRSGGEIRRRRVRWQENGGGGGNRTHVRLPGIRSVYASSRSIQVSAAASPTDRIRGRPAGTGSRRRRSRRTGRPARVGDARPRVHGRTRADGLPVLGSQLHASVGIFGCAGGFKRWPTTSSRNSRPAKAPSKPIAPTWRPLLRRQRAGHFHHRSLRTIGALDKAESARNGRFRVNSAGKAPCAEISFRSPAVSAGRLCWRAGTRHVVARDRPRGPDAWTATSRKEPTDA